jgi:hypothetical protein
MVSSLFEKKGGSPKRFVFLLVRKAASDLAIPKVKLECKICTNSPHSFLLAIFSIIFFFRPEIIVAIVSEQQHI